MALTRGGRRYRSILFAPPKNIGWLTNPARVEADAVLFDLEDGVPRSMKAEARTVTADAIGRLQEAPFGRLVRVNGWGQGELVADLVAVTSLGLDGIALSKTTTPDDVVAADMVLTELEMSRELPLGHIEIIPLPETPEGLLRSHELAMASSRVKRCYGIAYTNAAGDVARALGLRVSSTGTEWLSIGAQVLVGARAAGVTNLLGATVAEVDDLALVRQAAEISRVYGANGGICIHPSHVPVLNSVYAPTSEEIEEAETILAASADPISARSIAEWDAEIARQQSISVAFATLETARRSGLPVGAQRLAGAQSAFVSTAHTSENVSDRYSS